jgi:hypothetical protein
MTPTSDEKPTLPQGPGFGLTFLYYFAGTALVTTLLATKTLGVGLETGIPNQFGLLFGAIGGGLGALVNRSSSLILTCPSQKNFKQQLTTILAEMGYTESTTPRTDGILVYCRPPLSQAFSGKIYVLLEGKKAQLSSRAIQVNSLRKQLAKAGIK